MDRLLLTTRWQKNLQSFPNWVYNLSFNALWSIKIKEVKLLTHSTTSQWSWFSPPLRTILGLMLFIELFTLKSFWVAPGAAPCSVMVGKGNLAWDGLWVSVSCDSCPVEGTLTAWVWTVPSGSLTTQLSSSSSSLTKTSTDNGLMRAPNTAHWKIEETWYRR